MQNIFQKPIAQKILLVVLLSGIATVIYVSAATNIGTNISTDGSLSVTGTTTLSAMLNVDDINVALSGASDVGLNITGTMGTGIETTRPIVINAMNTDSYGSLSFYSMNSSQEGIVFNPSSAGIKGINWWGASPSSTFLYSDYLDGVGAHFDLKGTTGRGMELAMSNASQIGIDITGTLGTGIQTTRPINFLERTDSTNYGINFANNYTAGGIKFHNASGNHYPWIYGDLGPNSVGIDIDWVDATSVGYLANYLEGIGFQAIKTYDGAIGFQADWTNNSKYGTAVDINLSHASDVGIDISGTAGTGIQTTRPYEWRPTSGSGNIPAIRLEPGTEFASNGSTGAIYFANDIISNGVGIMFDGIDGTGTGIYQYLGNWTGSGGTGIHQDFGGSSGGSVGLSMNMYSSASDMGLNISGTLGTGIKTTRPIDLETMSSKPTCDNSTRGQIFYVEGGAGVADTVEICTKDAGDAYAWRTLQ